MPDIPTQFIIRPGRAAKMIGCSRNTVHNYLRRGTINGIRTPDGTWLVDVRSCKSVPKASTGRPRGA